MKKNIPYRDQLLELCKLYKINEVRSYINSKKKLTSSQIELILLKNKVRLPEHSYNKKKIAEIRFKEQVLTNVLITAWDSSLSIVNLLRDQSHEHPNFFS